MDGLVTFDQSVLDCWGFLVGALAQDANPIAPCEAAMVPIGLWYEAHRFKNRRVCLVVGEYRRLALYG